MLEPRIVSLIASATEIVDALGQLDHLVGRSHECDYPESVLSLPVCTRPRIAVNTDSREIDRQVKESARTAVSIYHVFDDVLTQLAPTHILTQFSARFAPSVCATWSRRWRAAFPASQPSFRYSPIRSTRSGKISGAWRALSNRRARRVCDHRP